MKDMHRPRRFQQEPQKLSLCTCSWGYLVPGHKSQQLLSSRFLLDLARKLACLQMSEAPLLSPRLTFQKAHRLAANRVERTPTPSTIPWISRAAVVRPPVRAGGPHPPCHRPHHRRPCVGGRRLGADGLGARGFSAAGGCTKPSLAEVLLFFVLRVPAKKRPV